MRRHAPATEPPEIVVADPAGGAAPAPGARIAMEYVSLGSTGLKVSRLCLGMMTYGSPSWRDWVLPEEAGRHFVRQASTTASTSSTPRTCTPAA